MNNEIVKEYTDNELELVKLEQKKQEILLQNEFIFKQIKKLEEQQKELENKQKVFKEKLVEVMTDVYNKTENDVFENEFIRIKYTPSYDKTIIDNDKLKKEYEEVYLNCLKKSNVKASVRITMKN